MVQTKVFTGGIRASGEDERIQFYTEVKDYCYECVEQGVGTYYFVNKGSHLSYTWFDLAEEEQTTFTNNTHNIRKGIHLGNNTFLLSGYLLQINEASSNCTVRAVNAQTQEDLSNYYVNQTSVHKTGLSRVRQTAEPDFSLKTETGEEIRVHKAVLEGLWPFFKGMVGSNMKEVADETASFPMPKSTLEATVRYLYGEDLELTFEDAANLIVFAQMYGLPELLEIATNKVKAVTMDIDQSVLLWRKSFEAKNDDVKDYTSTEIEKLMPEVDNFNAKIEHLEKLELVSLFQDVSMAMSNKKRKIDDTK